MGRTPINRKGSTDNFAWGQSDKIPIGTFKILSDSGRTRSLLKWNTDPCMPESVFVQLSIDYTNTSITYSAPILVLAKIDWTVQTANFTALLDFVHGTKFSIIADGFTISSFTETGSSSGASDFITVSALVTQNTPVNINGLAPQRTILDTGDPVFFLVPHFYSIPAFARKLSVLRASSGAFSISFLAGGVTLATTPVPVGGDLIDLPIPGAARTVRIAPSAPFSIVELNLIFALDL